MIRPLKAPPESFTKIKITQGSGKEENFGNTIESDIEVSSNGDTIKTSTHFTIG